MTTSGIPTRLLTLLFFLLASAFTFSRASTLQMTEDADLVKKVREASAKGLSFREVEKHVGVKATVNTVIEENHKSLTFLSLARDETPGLRLPFIDEDFAEVVCWIRPFKNNGIRVIGIYLTKKGEHRLFYAVLVPVG